MTVIDSWKERARQLKREIYAMYLACRDPRVPWYAKVCAGCVVAYAFSPIDLIPDPIPVLGQLDDLILIPLGVLLVRGMIPATVFEECREKAATATGEGIPVNRIAAAVIVGIWIALVTAFLVWAAPLFGWRYW